MRMRRFLPALIAVSLVGLAPADSQAAGKTRPIVIKAEPITLSADQAKSPALGSLHFRGGLLLTSPDSAFTGYSGLWVSPDGRKLAAVDEGQWLQASLSYDRAGNLSGLNVDGSGPLLDEAGKPLVGEAEKDAEALDFDGRRFLVGFEGNSRVVAYRSFTSPAQTIALPPEALAGIFFETGFSSVAALPGGRMIALPEYAAEGEHASQRISVKDYVPNKTRGWLITPKGSGSIWLRQSDDWLPVSLSTFPNGDLLLLELGVSRSGPITHTRVSRIAADQVVIGGTMQSEELAMMAPPMPGSRIEGSSIRRGPKGETLIYLLSNDKSVLYMFEVTPKP